MMTEVTNRRRHAIGRRIGSVAVTAVAAAGLSVGFLTVGPAGAASSHSSKSVVVSTAKNSQLGTILVSGHTLYTLSQNKTACSTQCLKTWPELTLPAGVTKATAGKGVTAAKLGTVRRSGGVLQVTYGGKALYFFSKDTAAGQVHGDVTDTWGKWTVIVTVKPSSSSSGNPGTGGVAF